jgi:hypothetical protein
MFIISFFSINFYPSRPTLNYWGESVSLILAQRENEIVMKKVLELGTVIQAEESDLLLFTMSETIFLADTDYWIRVRLEDSTGLLSSWSDPLGFFTVMENPYDLDGNGIDDFYQVDGTTDTNDNGINDSTEGILAVSDGEQGKIVGVSVDKGAMSGLASLSTADIPDGVLTDVQMPYGLFSYRIDGLTPGETVEVTFYFPDDMPSTASWFKYDSADGTLLDYTANTVISGNKVVLSITDGASGDMDGTENGIIIDPIGPVFIQDSETDPGTDTDTDNGASNTNGGGGCFIATAAYGSAQEHHVMMLREFRDRFLLKHVSGRAFVTFYYKYSPPMANYIAQHDTIRMYVRWGLFPLVWLSQVILWIGHGVIVTLFISLVLLFMFASVLIIKFHQNKRWSIIKTNN